MTFYEAALRVLESEGRPLHFQEITERSIAQALLSHVGKTPEQTMLSRLAAMARRKGDRRVMVTAKDTFALVEWALPEDVEALAQTGLPEPHPEEGLPPLRPEERHPEPRTENVRAAGRGADRKRHREAEEERGKKKRFPPVPEVVFEALSEAGEPVAPQTVLERLREGNLVSQELSLEALLTALLEDNQKRIDAGRRPQFIYAKDSGELSLERAGAPSEAPPLELQAAFAAALGIPLEGGRPVLGKPAAPSAEAQAEEGVLEVARAAVKEARKAMAKALRRRLADLEAGTFERAVVKMLHGQGFRELKVAKRGKEGPLLTARRREGSVELRFAIRMHKGNGAVDRRMVQELRKDLGHYSAQVGLLLSAGDVRGDARSEAQASGALVMLWCGEALAEKFFEAHTGVSVVQLELLTLDEAFFAQMAVEADEARKRREERHKEREEKLSAREQRKAERAEARAKARAEAGEAAGEEAAAEGRGPRAAEAPAPKGVAEAVGAEEGEEEGEEEEDLAAAAAFVGGAEGEAAGAEEGAAGGERRRRRRRRRGRRGRGGRGEGEAGAPAAEGAAPAAEPGAQAAEGAAPAEAAAVLPEAGGAAAAVSEGLMPEAAVPASPAVTAEPGAPVEAAAPVETAAPAPQAEEAAQAGEPAQAGPVPTEAPAAPEDRERGPASGES